MSSYGARRGVPDYDQFRTGLTYRQVRAMAAGRQYRRRGTVLGLWNQLKRELFFAATGVLLGCGSIVPSAPDAGAD